MFPILVHELYKGVMEYISFLQFTLNQKYQMIIGMEDTTLPAEVWDLRLGPVIWKNCRSLSR